MQLWTPRTSRRLWAFCLCASLVSLAPTSVVSAQGVQEQLRAAQAALLPQAVATLAGVQWWETGYVMPVEGRMSSPFGWRNISVNGNRFHGGVDFAASPGSRVVAARSGRVARAGWWGTYGYVVVLDHGDGSETRYAHLSSYAVAAGDVVRQGDTVGGVGSTGASTGPHLHFEIRLNGSAVDPLPYLRGER